MENKCRKCWKIIWEIYTDKILRCDTCREIINSELEWENRWLKVAVQSLHDEIVEQDKEYQTLCEMNLKLLEENKNLKLIQATNEKQLKNDIKERDELRKENKRLKAELDKRQQWKYRYFWNDWETDLYEDA